MDMKDLGLEQVVEISWTDHPYEWDTTTVLIDPLTKVFYWESGSGRSCNGPLEDVTKREDLESGSFFACAKEITERQAELMASTRPFGETDAFKEAASGEALRGIEAMMRAKAAPVPTRPGDSIYGFGDRG